MKFYINSFTTNNRYPFEDERKYVGLFTECIREKQIEYSKEITKYLNTFLLAFYPILDTSKNMKKKVYEYKEHLDQIEVDFYDAPYIFETNNELEALDIFNNYNYFPQEIYRVLNENENYSISNLGNVRNDRTKRSLKCYVPTKNNYLRCDLDSKPRVNLNVAKTVVKYFGNIISDLDFDVIHKDGDITNCDINNLQVKYKVNQKNIDYLINNFIKNSEQVNYKELYRKTLIDNEDILSTLNKELDKYDNLKYRVAYVKDEIKSGQDYLNKHLFIKNQMKKKLKHIIEILEDK